MHRGPAVDCGWRVKFQVMTVGALYLTADELTPASKRSGSPVGTMMTCHRHSAGRKVTEFSTRVDFTLNVAPVHTGSCQASLRVL